MFLYFALKWCEDDRAGQSDSVEENCSTCDAAGVPALQILHEKLGFQTFKVTSCLTGADKMHIEPH